MAEKTKDQSEKGYPDREVEAVQPEEQVSDGCNFAEPGLRGAPHEFLATAIAAASVSDPVIDLGGGERRILAPDGFTLHAADDPHRLPPYIKQLVTVDDADSLIVYTNRFSDARSVIIAALDALKITTALDWHRDNGGGGGAALAAQPAEHLVSLKLRNSEEYARWAAMEGKLHSQMEFAEFLDENSADIVDPNPAVMIEIARDLEATQGLKFRAATRLQTGERSFSYETETHVKNDLVVPQRFRLAIPIFHGEEPTEIEASFRFRPQADGLKLGFVWRRVEFVRQAMFRGIAYRVAEATGRPVIMGRAG